MQAAGLPRTELDVIDYSKLVLTGLSGLIAVAIDAAWGAFDTPTICGSWPEYVKTFGGLVTGNDGPLICKRTFEGGGKLKITRVGHRADQTINTLSGLQATADLVVDAVDAVSATAVVDITGATSMGTGAIWHVTVGGNPIDDAGYTVGAGNTATQVAAGLRAAINAATGDNGGYTASNTGAVLTVTAPSVNGADYNGLYLDTDSSTGGNGLAADLFEGGVTAVGEQGFTATATHIGVFGNKAVVTTTPAKSGTAGKIDVTVTFTGYPDLTTQATEVSEVISGAALDALNAQLVNVIISAVSVDGMGVGVLPLASGTNGTVVALDYVGNETLQSGIRAFDTSKDIWKLSCPAIADPAVDAAIEAYINMRKGMIGIIRMPVGTAKADWLGYRNGTGTYDHAAIDNWRMCAFGGGLRVRHPETGNAYDMTELGDVFAAMSGRSNTTFEWFSFAGQKRGRVRNVLGVVKDYGGSALRASADQLYENQINLVIDHESFGPVIWGNRTMQKNPTLLTKLNVAELIVFLEKNLPGIAQTEAFDPNDVNTWRTIYRNTKQFMDYVASNRGVQGPEGLGWVYNGDQDVDNVQQAVLNTEVTREAGMYKYRLGVAPTVALEYIWIEVAVTNSSAIATITNA